MLHAKNQAHIFRDIFAIRRVEIAAISTLLLPVRANHAHAGKIFLRSRGKHGERRLNFFEEIVDDLAEIAHRERDDRHGHAARTSVRVGEIISITATARTKVTIVVALYMIPGPSTMRTLLRSFVQRDISSPVRLRT